MCFSLPLWLSVFLYLLFFLSFSLPSLSFSLFSPVSLFLSLSSSALFLNERIISLSFSLSSLYLSPSLSSCLGFNTIAGARIQVKTEVRSGPEGEGDDEEEYSDEGSLEAKEYFLCTNAAMDS